MVPPSNDSEVLEGNELRQRLPQRPTVPRQASSVQSAKQAVIELNAAEGKSTKDESQRRTFGRTPGGTVFTVPHTHDMVSQLLSPTQPKNLSDLIVLVMLGMHILTLYMLPANLRIPVFAVVYLFWRACYNGGIGWLLYQQSNYNLMVIWAQKSKIFENPSTGKNPHPVLYKILKREMETKIPKDYKFEDAPLEYNAWLTFRRVVDLVLMCDFVSYCLFAIACGIQTHDDALATTIGRWTGGIVLVLFNLWVKLDAHRVVKDFAWYWGDFFYLIDQELTFDGVFEMAPHPMYSVGYAGYYGISLMAGSYKVLFISIVAHAAQFAFLTWVENPHIEKTYNPPPPRKRGPDPSLYESIDDLTDSRELGSIDHLSPALTPVASTYTFQPPATKDILGLQNLDLHRVIDVSALLLQAYFSLLALVTPSTTLYQFLFVSNAVIARLWYSVGIGYILDQQSRKKKWTRHFIKYGESSDEAWRQWKGIYHLSMTMCYASFVVAAFKMYSLPPDWDYGMATLRHVLGVALIALQVWTAVSIYDSLGEFGWFFGDFFFERGSQLTYSGIYRFLNNPERVIGLAGVWGFAILTWSKAIFFLAFLSHILTLGFIHFVERPHMQRRYGQSLRANSGLSKSFKRSLPTSLQSWHGSVDRVLEDTADFVEDFLESAAPKFAAGVDTIVKDTKALFNRYPARVSITRLSPGSDLANFDLKEYSLQFQGTPVAKPVMEIDDKASGREGEMGQTPLFEGKEFQPVMLEYGAPLKVSWTAPLHHSKRDWVGLYMLADNTSKDVTRIATQGRWIATSKGIHDARGEQGILIADKQTIKWEGQHGQPLMTGEMEFAGDKLWWTTGVFEFRYHHDGKHNVMAVSKPFEIRIARIVDAAIVPQPSPSSSPLTGSLDLSGDSSQLSDPTLGGAGSSARSAVEQALLPVVRNCFDRDPEIAPNAVDEAFGALVEREGKFAKRVVFALREMFGIEFSPGVVKADGNIRNLAWRVCNAKLVLAPYSMSASASASCRASTPTGDK